MFFEGFYLEIHANPDHLVSSTLSAMSTFNVETPKQRDPAGCAVYLCGWCATQVGGGQVPCCWYSSDSEKIGREQLFFLGGGGFLQDFPGFLSDFQRFLWNFQGFLLDFIAFPRFSWEFPRALGCGHPKKVGC